jgi:hypothetical protein
MTARVRRISHDGVAWTVVLLRDHELSVPFASPVPADLPADVLEALADWAQPPLAEWTCPSCGATTRARMADRPETP